MSTVIVIPARGGSKGIPRKNLQAINGQSLLVSAISRALAAQGYDHTLMFTAHDMLEVHRSMLISGAMSYVLDQDVHYVVTSAARVLRALCDGVRGALSISNPRVDIVTAENLA